MESFAGWYPPGCDWSPSVLRKERSQLVDFKDKLEHKFFIWSNMDLVAYGGDYWQRGRQVMYDLTESWEGVDSQYGSSLDRTFRSSLLLFQYYLAP